ncbi:phosphonatase-like hydrolase [Actinocrispum wychmicini]|uniref:Phosphonatase-like hydrolase n=1 Tax=Actinocrispum wychmicini TaxID=1213861 RepID=A0A4R2IM97_9PSEU|nr:phosphonatase-like hydrolase [Actinocrispum wychmicini]TCO45817.1 phosphonatase-like hydrolase [Actinocrispum wychmicini]
MITLAVLDIAGTTVQEHGAVYRALAEAVDAPESLIPPWMGADKEEAIKGLLTELGRTATPELVSTLYADFRQRLDDSYTVKPPEPLPRVTDALAHLRSNGVQVALTTGFDRAVTDTIVRAVGWQDTLDAVICTEDVPQGRPAPYMIYHAMEATGVVDISQVLVAGDTTRDLQSGTNAGAAMVIGVLTGGQDAETLGAVRHTHILPSVADIPDLLGHQ